MSAPRKRHRRLPLPRKGLVDRCRLVAGTLDRVPSPSSFERQVFDRFRALTGAAAKDERDLCRARALVAKLTARLGPARVELAKELSRVDALISVRYGFRSPALLDHHLPPRRKPGPRPARRRRQDG